MKTTDGLVVSRGKELKTVNVYIRTSNVFTTEFCKKGFVLLGLRVARAAHSASNGSDITAFVRVAIDGGGCGGELAGEVEEE